MIRAAGEIVMWPRCSLSPNPIMPSEESRWQELGSANPYWAVCTHERYRSGRMTEEDMETFFASGEQEVETVLAAIRRNLVPDFRPERALDFGCGVGRLTIPVARASERVVGVDLSEPMLTEARRNCVKRGVKNAEFLQTKAFLADSAPRYDLIYSYIVFQHIPPSRGMEITDQLLTRLRSGGVGALHYTYARLAGPTRKAVHRMRRWLPPVNWAVNVLQKRRLLEPMIPVHEYDLGKLFALLQCHGCSEVWAILTDHGGHLGAMLLFRKA